MALDLSVTAAGSASEISRLSKQLSEVDTSKRTERTSTYDRLQDSKAADVSASAEKSASDAKTNQASYATQQAGLSRAQSAVSQAQDVGEDIKTDLQSIQDKVKQAQAEDISAEDKAQLQTEIDDLVKGIGTRVKDAAEDGINLAAGSKKDSALVNQLGDTKGGDDVDVSSVSFNLQSLGLDQGVSLDGDLGALSSGLDAAISGVDDGLDTLEDTAETLASNSQQLQDDYLSQNSQSAVAAFESFRSEQNAEFFGEDDGTAQVSAPESGISLIEDSDAALSASQQIADQLASSQNFIANNNPSFIQGIFGNSA